MPSYLQDTGNVGDYKRGKEAGLFRDPRLLLWLAKI